MRRRTFLGLLGATPSALLNARSSSRIAWAPGSAQPRAELTFPPVVGGRELTLTAREATVDLGSGRARAWTLDGGYPGPTIRLRRGERAQITLRNELAEETILHWHGLDVPEASDGHPRLAIAPGERYEYDFVVRDPPGLYWYHPHTHERTAPQTYMGMAGLIVVEDEPVEGLTLPAPEHEMTLVLQDKRLGPSGEMLYDPGMGHDVMMGYLGDAPFVNGTHNASVDVRRGIYRLRVLNAANARLFDLGLDRGTRMTLIGSDGGLLPAPARVDRLMIGTGERVDLLVDFSAFHPGDRLTLRSHAFEIPGMGMTSMGRGGPGMRGARGGMRRGRGMGGMMDMPMQGTQMDLLELVVTDEPGEAPKPLPARLAEIPSPALDGDTPRRSFRFDSRMMEHTVNGRRFEMERVDFRTRMGRAEVWTFVNEAGYAHPVHVHAGQFRVLSRAGGRGALMPWERGLKDTVLVFPGERVEVAVRFDRHPGMYLMHCHNLEHEDHGMMANFTVEE